MSSAAFPPEVTVVVVLGLAVLVDAVEAVVLPAGLPVLVGVAGAVVIPAELPLLVGVAGAVELEDDTTGTPFGC